MAVTATRKVSIEKFKATKGIKVIHNRTSKKTGRNYFITEDEEFVGMELPDFDKTKPVFVITFLDGETSETWNAVGNSMEMTNNYSLQG